MSLRFTSLRFRALGLGFRGGFHCKGFLRESDWHLIYTHVKAATYGGTACMRVKKGTALSIFAVLSAYLSRVRIYGSNLQIRMEQVGGRSWGIYRSIHTYIYIHIYICICMYVCM